MIHAERGGTVKVHSADFDKRHLLDSLITIKKAEASLPLPHKEEMVFQTVLMRPEVLHFGELANP